MFTRDLDSKLLGKDYYRKIDGNYEHGDEMRSRDPLRPFDREARDGEAQFDAPMYVIWMKNSLWIAFSRKYTIILIYMYIRTAELLAGQLFHSLVFV